MSIKKSLLTSAMVAISTEQVKKQSPADSDNRCQQVKALESLTAKVARSDKDAELSSDIAQVSEALGLCEQEDQEAFKRILQRIHGVKNG